MKYFHASTVIRRCRNKILELKSGGGEWISGHSSIRDELMAFFSSLYTTDHPTIPQDLDNLVAEVITTDENALLIRVPDG